MDKTDRIVSIVRDLNAYNLGRLKDYELIEKVCDFFDNQKTEKLNQTDKKLLIHLANKTGIPHYYDMLTSFIGSDDLTIDTEEIGLSTLSSFLYESSLFSKSSKLHRYQKNILDKFKPGNSNRYFLSASTSFGKTHIAFEIIKKMEYPNVALIFPTIALLSENLERILNNENGSYTLLKEKYQLHTLSQVDEFGHRNLFIYTPERFLSFLEKNSNKINFDFVFVDEVYKIDNEYIIDEEARENERDTAYRLAVYYGLQNTATDILLAGPYVEFFGEGKKNYNNSFDTFCKKNDIEVLNYNEYEIVRKNYKDIISKNAFEIQGGVEVKLSTNNKTNRLIQALEGIVSNNQNAIVYCPETGKRAGVEKYAEEIIKSKIFNSHNYLDYQDLLEHIESNFPSDWILIEALKNGIGIHHGLIPKYIQKEIVSLFNSSNIKVLISTTTITEGVNTSAKNLIVMKNKKGDKVLKKFDAKNIAGRAGRFGFHYSGEVLALDKAFLSTIESEGEGIKHKNYDVKALKREIDLFYTNDEFLSDDDKKRKVSIREEQLKRGIPDEIMNHYKVVSRKDKIDVYDLICQLSRQELDILDKLFFVISTYTEISFEGFQIILNTIRPIVRNKQLESLIDTRVLNKKKNEMYSVLSSLVIAYLKGGIKGSIDFKKESQGKTTDKAISETSRFVYNILKYQVVKYLGVFNIMYKYRMTQISSVEFDDVRGLDKLLMKFEYNAITDEGRIVSDYGVPTKVLDYYENPKKSNEIKASFDDYELRSFIKVNQIIESSSK